MRTLTKLGFIIAVAVAARPGLVAPAQAQAVFTDFTGSEICWPIDFGSWAFSDGNIHIRGMVMSCAETTSTPLMQGENIIVLNANLKAVPGALLGGVGPMSGTWEMDNWTGTWEGFMYEDGGIYHAQGTGRGSAAGMKCWLDTDHGQFTGRILRSAR